MIFSENNKYGNWTTDHTNGTDNSKFIRRDVLTFFYLSFLLIRAIRVIRGKTSSQSPNNPLPFQLGLLKIQKQSQF